MRAGDPGKCGTRQGDRIVASSVAKCTSEPQSAWRITSQARSTEFEWKSRSGSRAEARRWNSTASAWASVVRRNRMSAIELATSCLYRLRGSLKKRSNNVDADTPLECKGMDASGKIVKCSVCKRFYHPKCDHLTRSKFLSSTWAAGVVEPVDDVSQSKPPQEVCESACTLAPNVGKQICFPCEYDGEFECVHRIRMIWRVNASV